MTKQIQNLILKHGVEKLNTMIDQTYAEMQDCKKLDELLESSETARAWFEQYCADNNHTFIDCYNQTQEQQDQDYHKYGKSCLALNGWRSNTPYVYLWLNKDGSPHFEMSSTDAYNIESYFGYNDLTKKIAKIVELHKETA
tara:strand:- start:393 stop:815 length:423 start_codon:yes stop_codon:yes gene_type:complete